MGRPCSCSASLASVKGLAVGPCVPGHVGADAEACPLQTQRPGAGLLSLAACAALPHSLGMTVFALWGGALGEGEGPSPEGCLPLPQAQHRTTPERVHLFCGLLVTPASR